MYLFKCSLFIDDLIINYDLIDFDCCLINQSNTMHWTQSDRMCVNIGQYRAEEPR